MEYEEQRIVAADESSFALLSPQGSIITSFSQFSDIIAVGKYSSSSGILVVHQQQNHVIVSLIPESVSILALHYV